MQSGETCVIYAKIFLLCYTMTFRDFIRFSFLIQCCDSSVASMALFFKNYLYFYLCICVFLHELVCTTFVQVRPEDIGCPGVGVIGVGELPDVGAGD